MNLEDLFKVLKEEAGPDGAVVLFMVSPKKGEDLQVLVAGSAERLSWLVGFGSQKIQQDCQSQTSGLVTGEWKCLKDLTISDLEGSPWDVIQKRSLNDER